MLMICRSSRLLEAQLMQVICGALPFCGQRWGWLHRGCVELTMQEMWTEHVTGKGLTAFQAL